VERSHWLIVKDSDVQALRSHVDKRIFFVYGKLIFRFHVNPVPPLLLLTAVSVMHTPRLCIAAAERLCSHGNTSTKHWWAAKMAVVLATASSLAAAANVAAITTVFELNRLFTLLYTG